MSPRLRGSCKVFDVARCSGGWAGGGLSARTWFDVMFLSCEVDVRVGGYGYVCFMEMISDQDFSGCSCFFLRFVASHRWLRSPFDLCSSQTFVSIQPLG